MKKVLITGITGQDGSYLAEFLLQHHYEVYGFYRKVSDNANLGRVQHLIGHKYFHLIPGDLTDPSSIYSAILHIKPDELYNLGALSNVTACYELPGYCLKVNGEAMVTILNCIRDFKLSTKVYNAGTSELFGITEETVSSSSPLNPVSTYATAKLLAYQTCKNYREQYGISCFTGFAFPHESERRGEEFFTQKIVKQAVDIFEGKRQYIEVGNINTKRDFCYAPEITEGYYKILQAEKGDFLLCSGDLYSLRELIAEVFFQCGFSVIFEGKGLQEVAKDEDGVTRLKINPAYFRPSDPSGTRGNPEEAEEKIGFKTKKTLKDIVEIMVDSEFKRRGLPVLCLK